MHTRALGLCQGPGPVPGVSAAHCRLADTPAVPWRGLPMWGRTLTWANTGEMRQEVHLL